MLRGTSFQNERFARCFRQFSRKICVSLQFRAIDTPIPARGFIRQKQKCASHYSAVHSQMWQCAFRHSAVRKNVWIHRPWTDPLRAHKNARFYYSFGRSTPRFYWEGWPRANEICVSLQFWAIDNTFLLRGLTERKWNMRFATVSGDRHHVFSKRVDTWKWNLRFATVLGDRHHVFTERVDREKMKFAFRYSFGRSTPRF